jgi:hypothetical protein
MLKLSRITTQRSTGRSHANKISKCFIVFERRLKYTYDGGQFAQIFPFTPNNDDGDSSNKNTVSFHVRIRIIIATTSLLGIL